MLSSKCEYHPLQTKEIAGKSSKEDMRRVAKKENGEKLTGVTIPPEQFKSFKFHPLVSKEQSTGPDFLEKKLSGDCQTRSHLSIFINSLLFISKHNFSDFPF